MKKIILPILLMTSFTLSYAQTRTFSSTKVADGEAIDLATGVNMKEYQSHILGENGPDAPRGVFLYDTSLIRQIKAQALDSVQMLIYARVDPNEKNDEGFTPAAIAAEVGNMDIMRFLVETGKVDINMPSVFDITPLIQASANSHDKIIEYLISKGAVVDTVDTLGKSALSHAAEHGCVKCIDILVKNTADVNRADKLGDTPLTLAIKNQQDKAAVALIKYGSDINYTNSQGESVSSLTLFYMPKSKTAKELKKRYKKMGVDFPPKEPKAEKIIPAAPTAPPAPIVQEDAIIIPAEGELKPEEAASLQAAGVDAEAVQQEIAAKMAERGQTGDAAVVVVRQPAPQPVTSSPAESYETYLGIPTTQSEPAVKTVSANIEISKKDAEKLEVPDEIPLPNNTIMRTDLIIEKVTDTPYTEDNKAAKKREKEREKERKKAAQATY
ncbi:Ankyrin repeat [Parelusimicrobium proximum]|uniref:ankyrin repeat domain-containing protein n=1 Tax=Parelusimicrobium proximum TaxID=3228953 RepID=UPI003D163C2C